MGYWKKYLVDGSVEEGSDYQIHIGKASWTRGSQEIIKVKFTYDHFVASVNCPVLNGRVSDWKQFDGILQNTRTGETKRISRRIECQNIGYKFISKTHKLGSSEVCYEFSNSPERGDVQLIPTETSNVICEINKKGISLRFEG